MIRGIRRLGHYAVVTFAVSVAAVDVATAEPRQEVCDDWEFQFRTMGYGAIDTRSDAQRYYDEAQLRKPGDRRGDNRMRGIAAMIEYWRARNPNEEERKRLDDTERRLQALRASMEGVPDAGPEADKKWPHFDVENRILRGIVQLRPEAIGPGPLLLRNDETAPGVSLDDPPLLDQQAKFRPEDRDQVDVVLRRTRALVDYWLAKEPGAGKWKECAKRLAELDAAAKATQPDLTGKDAARHKVYLDLCALRRETVLANPLLDFEDLLFIEHSDVANYLERVNPYGVPRPGGGLYAMRGFKSGAPRVEDLVGKAVVENGEYAGRCLTNGVFQRPELSFDGRTIYFGWGELKPGRFVAAPYHIFRIGTDGTGLRQLTFGPASDMEPCELPNGRIMFMSTRRKIGDRCCGNNRTAFFQHSMKPDGSDIICLSFHETHEWEPSVDNNGMVVYSRWDYVDRPPQGPRNMWICYPDGSNPRAPHGNNGPNSVMAVFDPPIPGYYDSPAYRDWRKAAPLSEVSIRAIPGSHKYLAVAGGHDWNGIGPLIMIDLTTPDDLLHSQITRVTPEFYEHDNYTKWNMIWSTPWPLSEDFYLVNRYESIGILDRFGNFEEVHRMAKADAENRAFSHMRHLGCWSGGMGIHVRILGKGSEVDGSRMYWRPIYPIPLKARPRPPVLPARTFQEADRRGLPEHKPATIAVMNVYDTDVPLPKGAKVKWMRIVQILPWGNAPYGSLVGVAHFLNRTVLGVVPVEEDGSVYCEAPVERGIYFQLLDENGAAIHGMRSDTYVHPGEQMSCVGCHEKYSSTPRPPPATPMALRRPPSKIQAECADQEPTLFQRHIVPIFDGTCVSCHRREKKGPPAITWGYLKSEPEKKRCVTMPGQSTRTTPGEFGATSTFTWKHALEHKDAFKGDQLRRLAQWLDTYCPATATGEGDSASRQHAGMREWPLHPDFDPLNPMGSEKAGGFGADGKPIPAAWARALADEKAHEGRVALLDHLSWRLGTNAFSWGEAEDEAYRTLVPMLTDQRDRVYRTALRWLRTMADQDRKPAKEQVAGTAEAWREYYERKYPGKALDLTAAVRERIVVVKTGFTNAVGFVVDGEKVEDVPALEKRLTSRVKEGKDAGLTVTVVVQSPVWPIARGSVIDGKGIHVPLLAREDLEVEAAKQAAWRVAGNCTVYPESYAIRDPWVPSKKAMMPSSVQLTPPGDADWTISLAGLVGGKALRVVLASRDGQFTRALCPAGQYNAETHEVDVSGLRLSGDMIGGTLKVTLYADAWFPKDRKDVVCELSVDARAAGQEVAGKYAGTCNRVLVEGTLSGTIATPSALAKQVVSRLRFENAMTGVPNYMARTRLDVEWVEGLPRTARIRCGFKVPKGWAGRVERIDGKLTAESLQLDLQGMVGMQPGGTSIGAEQWSYSLRGTVVGTNVSGHFAASVNGRQERAGRFQGELIENGDFAGSWPDVQASAVTKPQKAIAVDARTATGGNVIMPWRSIALADFQGGLYAIGDLDGDGQCEFVVARDGLTGLVVYKLDGSVLWQWGSDRPGTPMSSDMPLQVWDLEGKGRDDVFIGVQGHLLVLDGRTGQETKRWKLPEGLGWADCITFANFRGLERARDIIVKTRHGAMWAYTDDWRLLWQWAPPAGYKACHHPQPVDVDGDGKDELIAGWSLLGPDGKPLWTMKSAISELKDGHCDSSTVVQTGRKPADARLAICYDNDNGLGVLDGEGRMLWEIGGSHFQLVIAGKMRADVPGNQIVTTIAYGRNDPTWILAEDGRLLVDILHVGSYNKLMDWDGDGLLELISSTAKVFNGKGQCVAELGLAQKLLSRALDDSPQRAVSANAVMVVDVDGDHRPEVVLFSGSGEPTGAEASPGAPRIRIYKSDQTPQLKDPPRRTFNFTLYN